MWPTLLLLIGLSSSVHLGEVSPGLLGQVIVQGRYGEAQTVVDTADKYDPPQTGGWRMSQSLDLRLGGVVVGGAYVYRRGGYWTKQFAWVHGGYQWQRPDATVRVLGRATVWSYLTWAYGNRPDIREVAAQIEYRRTVGRWVIAMTHGIVAYDQGGWQMGYAMTASAGCVFGVAQMPARNDT